MLLKPRFGSRMWSGIWPPSKPAIDTPERALAPFWPRPAVLPSPEPMPRPTRTRDWRAPLLSLISFSFMSLHSLSLLSRYERVKPPPRSPDVRTYAPAPGPRAYQPADLPTAD